MSVIIINDKTKLNFLAGRLPMAQFLQSWEWGSFQERAGRKVWRLGVEQGGELVDAVTVIKHDLPMGKSYLYMPRAIMSHEELVVRELKKIAKQENSILIKLEPAAKNSITQLLNYPITKITECVQPPTTLFLDLTNPEEKILSNMHQKTRYNIRLAEKHDVEVRESEKIDEFIKLNRETATRDKFKSHPDDYYRKMFEVLGTSQQQYSNLTIEQSNSRTMKQCYLKLYTAYYKNKAIASNIVIFFGDTTTYLHGASSNEYRNLMAPHRLQWEQIKSAQGWGYKWYDFWGVNPSCKAVEPHSPRASWVGVTRFKRGYVSEATGKEVSYPDCYDLIIQPFWCKLYKTFKYLRR